MKKKIEKIELESGVKQGTLESAIIVAACVIATPILLLISIIFGS